MQTLIKEIIDKSIKKFIYIDDRVCLPYEESNEHLSRSKEMFDAFLGVNKHLRICRYSSDTTTDEYKQLFDNNDILILDWHLNGEDLDENVFNIVVEAVKHKIIKYIFIYTGYEDQAYVDLLAAFDSLNYISNEEETLRTLNDAVCELSIEFEDTTFIADDKLTEIAFEVVRNKDKTTLASYQDSLSEHFSIDSNDLKRLLSQNGFDKDKLINIISYFYYKAFSDVPFKDLNVQLSHIGTSKNLVLDSTHLMVIPKDITPNMLLDKMYLSLSGEPHGYFNFLNHEILYKFHDHFFHHAKGIGKIHDAVVKKKYEGEEIEDFIETIYSDIFRSVLRNNEISLLKNTKQYLDSRGSITYNENINDLKDMNCFISNNIEREQLDSITRKQISFGDIFKVEIFKEEQKNKSRESLYSQMKRNKFKRNDDYNKIADDFKYKYAICITQHCDSLRPSKIDNIYSFVFSDGNHLSLTDNMDEFFCSFVRTEGQIDIISWAENKIVKPRSLFIKDKHDIRDHIIVQYQDYKLKLIFLCQQKDVFTQRLANEAFRYPMRVGVSYVNKLNSPTCKC